MKAELSCSRELDLGDCAQIKLRDLARWAHTAAGYKCSVTLACGDRSANGKSFMALLALPVNGATALSLRAWGAEAAECLEALSTLVLGSL